MNKEYLRKCLKVAVVIIKWLLLAAAVMLLLAPGIYLIYLYLHPGF